MLVTVPLLGHQIAYVGSTPLFEPRQKTTARKGGMKQESSAASKLRSRHGSRRKIRLAYKGRSGAQWTYSPTVTQSRPDWLEVSMLVPLAVGHPVDIEPISTNRSGEATPGRSIRARVTGCQCSPDGLFRIRLALPKS